MALLPEKIRYKLFDSLSLKTMRYVDAVSSKDAGPLVREIYDQIAEDFFINGSLTSRSKVPGVLAAIWTIGREAILVDDKIDRTTKEAMAATVSSINDCPYCGDMLVSLVHAGDRANDAKRILNEKEDTIKDPVLRQRLQWVRSVATPGGTPPTSVPFTTICSMSPSIRAIMKTAATNPNVSAEDARIVRRGFLHRFRQAIRHHREPGRSFIAGL